MEPIYNVSLSMAQDGEAPTVSATLKYTEGHQSSTVKVHWDMPHAIQAGGNVSEWLYAVLSRVVQDFDEHQVDVVSYESSIVVGEEERV